MELKDKLKLVPAIVVGGIRMWVEPPPKFKLKVDHDYEVRREAERQEMERKYGPTPRTKLPSGIKTRRFAPAKEIHLDFWDPHYKKWIKGQCSIAIDLEKRRIDYGRTSDWLFGRQHQGSGAIGVALFSLPVTLPLAPVLIGLNRYYRMCEEDWGMSGHGHAILKAVKGQLDADTEALLVEALKNTWKHDQAMSRKVDLEEAREILSTCDLRVDHVPAEVAERRGDVESRGFHWFNDAGDHVASGSFYGERDHYVQVLGSLFENEKADQLIGCYRTRKVCTPGDFDDETDTDDA